MKNPIGPMALATSLSLGAQAAPQTLLEMSKAAIKVNPKEAVVVFVDYQNEYLDGLLPLVRIRPVVKESARLLAWARDNNIPVVHVFHEGGKGGLFDATARNGQPIAEMAPQSGEKVVYKKFPNAFVGTDLKKFIDASGKTSVIFAGLMTHMCLEASARAAHEQGLATAVVESTTTTRDLRTPAGDTVKAEDLVAASLASLQDLVAQIIPDVSTLEKL